MNHNHNCNRIGCQQYMPNYQTGQCRCEDNNLNNLQSQINSLNNKVQYLESQVNHINGHQACGNKYNHGPVHYNEFPNPQVKSQPESHGLIYYIAVFFVWLLKLAVYMTLVFFIGLIFIILAYSLENDGQFSSFSGSNFKFD